MMTKKLPAGRAAPAPVTTQKPFGFRVGVLTASTALALGLFSANSYALSLGRLNVQSALGEPLRAEIDVPQITPDEASSLSVGVASPDAFRAAGFEYNPALGLLRLTLQRRNDGSSFIRVVGDRPINDPFIDLVLQASWSTGRVVRDYTMLFDPPNNRAPAPIAQQTAPQLTPLPSRTPAPPPVATRPAASPPTPVAAAPARPARPAPATPAASGTGSGNQVTVRAGDTAGKIAANASGGNVSLDQMLVAILRANPDAFIGGNINRIRAGAVIDLPTAEQAAATPAGEARQTIVAQSRDFNDFRRRLATNAPTTQVAPADRQAGGRVTARVEESRPSASTPDKLTLSKGAVSGNSSDATIAQNRQAQSTNDRVAELSRNINELNRLGAASSAVSGAAGAASAPGRPGVPATTASSALPSTSVVPPAAVTASSPAVVSSAPSTAATAAAAAAAASSPVSTASDVASAPAGSTSSAPVATPVRPASAPRPAPAPVPPPPPQSMVDELLDNPLIPIAAGAILLLIIGFAAYKIRQKKKAAQVDSSFLESRLQPDSFFGSSGGQRVDTNEPAVSGSSMAYSPSQLDAAGDVDPVAEADVYLAYGRDLQAEEILKEALRSNPGRVAIHAKLLEIYAKRRDTKAFEVVATQAYALAEGEGPEWERIVELGRELDPANPLYTSGTTVSSRAALLASNGTAIGATPSTISGGISPAGPQTDFAPTAMADSSPQPEFSPSLPASDIDLDLDFSIGDERVATMSAPLNTEATSPIKVDYNASRPTEPAGLDMDFSTATVGVKRPLPEAAQPEPSVDVPLLPELDIPSAPAPLDTVPAPVEAARPAPAEQANTGLIEFDLGALSLDLDRPDEAPSTMSGLPLEAEDPLETKLALAQEFSTIGDNEGARALAEEVVADAKGDLRERAQELLAKLS